MNDATFSLVTSLFTFGGLCGSLCANIFMDRYGRKGASRLSAIFNTAGAFLSAVAASVASIAVGRHVPSCPPFFTLNISSSGFSSVSLLVSAFVSAQYISRKFLTRISEETLVHNLRHDLLVLFIPFSGVGTQLAIVIGIMVTQVMGFIFATPKHWRLVLLTSAALSVLQYFTSPFVTESPVYLRRMGMLEQQKCVAQRLWGDDLRRDRKSRGSNINSLHSILSVTTEEHSEEPLLLGDDTPSPPDRDAVTLPQLLLSPEYRRALLIVVFAMSSQQLSGRQLPILLRIAYWTNFHRYQCRQAITTVPLVQQVIVLL